MRESRVLREQAGEEMTLQTPLFNKHARDTTSVESQQVARDVLWKVQNSHTRLGKCQAAVVNNGWRVFRVLSMKCELERWVRVRFYLVVRMASEIRGRDDCRLVVRVGAAA